MIKALITGLAVVVILLVATSVETWRNAKLFTNPTHERFCAGLILFAAALVVVLILAIWDVASASGVQAAAIADWKR